MGIRSDFCAEERKEIVQESSIGLLSRIPGGALLPSSGRRELGCLKRPSALNDFHMMESNYQKHVFLHPKIPLE